MRDWEFMRYLNMCSVQEIEDICKRYGTAVVLEDGKITDYRKEETNE